MPPRCRFGRHVRQRADHGATGEARVDALVAGDSEVGQERSQAVWLLGEQDVRRLDVSVHDAELVRGGQAVGQLAEQAKRLHRLEGTGFDPGLQVAGRQVRVGQVQPAIVLAVLVNGHDVRGVQPREQACLTFEPLAELRLVQRGAEQLQSHRAGQLLLLSEVDDAHRPATQLPFDQVVAEHITGLRKRAHHRPSEC